MPTWSAPVRYAEVDGQQVVFNAHYLTYCDEAMSAFMDQHGLRGISEQVQLVTSTQHWTSSARWRDTVDVDVRCARIGRTSFALHFDVKVAERLCCAVETTYVLLDDVGRPTPVPDEMRAKLS